MTPSDLTPQALFASGLCIGCGACGTRLVLDAFGEYRPTGAAPAGIGQICPFSPYAPDEDALAAPLFGLLPKDHRLGHHRSIYVGHSRDNRMAGSSGGLVTEMVLHLLEEGLIDGVAHVAPRAGTSGPLFGYRVSRTEAAIRAGAQSRY